MMAFQPRAGARFRCRFDFSQHSVAALQFCTADGSRIPLHLSLRGAEGLVVLNRRDAAGWRRELQIAHSFAPGGGELELIFGPGLGLGLGAVRLRIDGCDLGRFDGFPRPDLQGPRGMRRGFPGLAQIRGVIFEGGALPEGGLRPPPPPGRERLTGSPELYISRRLELVSAQPLPPLPLPQGDSLPVLPWGNGGFGAVLPGRIWQDRRSFSPLPGLHLTRADLARLLEESLAGPRGETDDFLALQLIDHARGSGLLPELSAQTARRLRQRAEALQLGAFLTAGGEGAQVTAPAPGGAAPPGAEARPAGLAQRHRLAAGLMTALRAGEAADPAPALAALPEAERGTFLLELTEAWCLAGRFAALRRCGERPGLPDGGGSPWQRSAGFPWRAAAGDPLPALAAELTALSSAPPGAWIVTPALAEGMEILLSRDWLPPGELAQLLQAWFRVSDSLAGPPLGRRGCQALLRVSAGLLRLWPVLPPWLRAELLAHWRRGPGLTPEFYTALAQTGPEHRWPEALRQARAQVLALFEPGRSPEALARLCSALEAWNNPALPRLRRILLGPGGAPEAQLAERPAADLLRALLAPPAGPGAAAPGADLPPEALARAASAAGPAWTGAVLPPLGQVQRRLGQRLPHYLRAGLPEGEEARALQRDLRALSGPEARHLGLALALLLAEHAPFRPAPGSAPAAGHEAAGAAALRLWLRGLPRVAAAAGPLSPARAPALAALPPELTAGLPGFPAPAPAVPAAAVPPPWPGPVSPLHDLLVVVISCGALLPARLPALRAAWLQDLARHGIPWIVVTGGAPAGECRLEGRHLRLDCPDDYEGLPQKSLALLRWFRDQTRFARLLKIDDDCFLAVEDFCAGLLHLNADWAGRALQRARGDTDRTWHQAKSRSPRGRLEIDKSPEPSRYADGGSGYVLSRRAVVAALREAETPAGQHLLRLSFMEDKLLGDLLGRAGIALQEEGWLMPKECRPPGGQQILPFWNNGPRPFAGSGILGVHLDGAELQSAARAAAAAPRPERGRIWPPGQEMRFGWASNALTLLSSATRLARAAAAEVAVVSVLRNEREMLPHFLAHYRALGVGGFLMADNGSADGSAEYLAAQPDVALFSADTPYSLSHYGVSWQEALLAAFRPGRWSLVADLDELLFWQADLRGDLPQLLRAPEFAAAEAVRVFMLDLYPRGDLAAADFRAGPFAAAGCADLQPFLTASGSRGPFSDQPTWTSGLRHRLMPGLRPELFVAQKLALLRYGPQMQLSAGLHYVSGCRIAPRDLLFGHFKYTPWFAAQVAREVARAEHFNGAEEYRRYQSLLAEGRRCLWEAGASGDWGESAFVRHLLARGRAPGS